MKKILLSLVAVVVAAGLFAQPMKSSKSKKKGQLLGLSFLLKDMYTANLIDHSSFTTVLDNKQWTKINDMGPGVSFNYYEGLTDYIDFQGTLAGSFTKYPFSASAGVAQPNLSNFLLELEGAINIKLLTDNYFISPYLHLGLGTSMYKGTYFAAYAPTGIGLQFNLGEETFVHAMWGYNIKVSDLSINHFTYSIGVSSPLKDRKPPVVVMPPPPPPVVVAEKDTDGDGIVDSKDKCPTVAGTAKYDGCPVPDTDGDGINDENDECKTVKGIAKYKGCPIPDRDGDGINDEEDKCPDVKGVARYQGCPIPDRDGDGINDEEDKCPDVKGVRENNGCPMVKEEVVKKVATSAKNIFFVTGSDKLLAKSFPALNDVAAILKEDQALKLDIEGHTDITGSDKINIPLSQKRAKAVYEYLTTKGGVDPSRVSSEGYGSSKPIADNKTAAGRALNRRVEMKLKYY